MSPYSRRMTAYLPCKMNWFVRFGTHIVALRRSHGAAWSHDRTGENIENASSVSAHQRFSARNKRDASAQGLTVEVPLQIFGGSWREIATRSLLALRIAALLSPLFVAFTAQAANICVGPSASGDGSGSNWSNKAAWSSLSLSRGNSYYLEDGNYTGRTLSTPASGSTLIVIKKATAADHGVPTGWSDTMGDGQAAFSRQMQFTTRYWVFDGAVGGGPSAYGGGGTSWKTGYGFKVVETSSTPVIWINGGGNVDISHVELQGAGDNGSAGGTGNDGFQVFEGSGPNTITSAYIHDVGRCMFYHGGSSTGSITASYIYTGRHESSSGEHSEWAILRSSALFTLRWSIIMHTEGTGGIIAGDNGQTTAEIYGNIFYDDGTLNWGIANNGLIAAFSTGSATVNWKVYNNTFISIPSGLSVYGISGQNPSGNQARNNYYYLSLSHTPGSGWSQAFDHFQDSGVPSGTNATSGVGDPFVDYRGFNFALKANTAPGDTSVPSQYRTDMFGRSGSTRGAIQFGGTTPPTPPPTPTPPRRRRLTRRRRPHQPRRRPPCPHLLRRRASIRLGTGGLTKRLAIPQTTRHQTAIMELLMEELGSQHACLEESLLTELMITCEFQPPQPLHRLQTRSRSAAG